MIENTPLLSICIATRNRADDIAASLDVLLPLCPPALMEVVVVDGASSDATPQVMHVLAARWPVLRYCSQPVNSGVDGDFDLAVQLARGTYCWLLSDDDLPTEGAVDLMLEACRKGYVAIISDAEVWSSNFFKKLHSGRMKFRGERIYSPIQQAELLSDCGDVLSFIGALTIRRDLWLQRERTKFYGSEFVHVGVVFQQALPGDVLAMSTATLRIRYGVGNWVKRAFDVWMRKWPSLIWSFDHLSEASRHAVTPRFPWRNLRLLLVYRSRGWFGWSQFRQYIVPAPRPVFEKFLPGLIALLPGRAVWLLIQGVLWTRPKRHPGLEWDLLDSPFALWSKGR